MPASFAFPATISLGVDLPSQLENGKPRSRIDEPQICPCIHSGAFRVPDVPEYAGQRHLSYLSPEWISSLITLLIAS